MGHGELWPIVLHLYQPSRMTARTDGHRLGSGLVVSARSFYHGEVFIRSGDPESSVDDLRARRSVVLTRAFLTMRSAET